MDSPTVLKTITRLESRPGSNWYYQEIEPSNDAESRGHVVVLDRQTWRDLGEPEVITVAVWPGDQLNHPTDAFTL